MLHLLDETGALPSTEDDAAALVGETYGTDTEWIGIPLGRLAPDMLQLGNRKLGLFIQKLVNYRLKVAIIGDVSGAMAASKAFNDFVVESNRGEMVWFAPDRSAFEDRLQARGWAAR